MAAKIELRRGALLRMRRAAGGTLTAHAGSVWITEEGSPLDVVLEPGEKFTFAGSGLALVEAFSDASVSFGE